MQEAYRRSLDAVLHHRRATIFVSIAMTALTICLFVVVPKSFMPAVDVPGFTGTLEASQDNSFDRMIAYGEEVTPERLAMRTPMPTEMTEAYSEGYELAGRLLAAATSATRRK